MPGGITCIPLPAFWSSSDPEQWRRCPSKSLACSNARCAANNDNYATILKEPAAKRPTRLSRASGPRSRSHSATSNSSNPTENEKTTKTDSVARCTDCNGPLTQRAILASSTAKSPPTHASVPCSSTPRLSRNYSSCGSAQGQSPRGGKRKLIPCAPPPSERDNDSSTTDELTPSDRNEGGSEYGGPAQMAHPSVEPQSEHPSTDFPQYLESVPPDIGVVCTEETRFYQSNEVASDFQSGVPGRWSNSPDSTQVVGMPLFTATQTDDVKSESSASLPACERALDSGGLFIEKACVSSFYNALYTPDVKPEDLMVNPIGDCEGVDCEVRLKFALEVAVLSAFVTVLVLACFPSLLSGLRYHVLGCCSCSCQSPADFEALIKGSSFGQWVDRWVQGVTEDSQGCPSTRIDSVVGSTVLR